MDISCSAKVVCMHAQARGQGKCRANKSPAKTTFFVIPVLSSSESLLYTVKCARFGGISPKSDLNTKITST